MASAQVSSNQDQEQLEIPSVPQKYFGILGNLPDVDGSFFASSLWRMNELYGGIYKLSLGPKEFVVISDYDLVLDALNDDRFEKVPTGALIHVRDMLGDGLFTAFNDERNWWKAHRILMPAFGPMSIKKMFNQQLDIASQMILKWDRLGPKHEILTSDDFTRLAFDTIGFCAFSYRFNEFYGPSIHPFAQQMTEALVEASIRSAEIPLQTKLRYFANQKYWHNIEQMQSLAREIIEDRVKDPKPDTYDLLNVMLNTEDPDTNEKLSTQNILYNMCTFLIAGHETTSGTLCFLFYHLLSNPEFYHKVQREVDEVVGDDALTLAHLSKLKYLDACINETLRYMGPIWGIRREPRKAGTLLGGKYLLKEGMSVLVNLKDFHQSPVWGEDSHVFRPERWLEGQTPKGAFRPFGAGLRACIGRQFAEQEMLITTALILQRFQVELANPEYKLKIKATLTIKPDELFIKVRRRPGKSDMVGLQGQDFPTPRKQPEQTSTPVGEKPPMTILYGSNAGTCKSYAEDLLAKATNFNAHIETLDAATESLPKNQPVIILTPSYEGKPADNAKKFVAWLESKKDSPELLSGVQYALFGVGNSDWQVTYQKVPKLVDDLFKKLGATSIQEAQYADVKHDPMAPWEDFKEALFTSLGQQENELAQMEVTITPSEAADELGVAKMSQGTVLANIDLADDSVGPPKKHIDIELPEGVKYQSGDYLSILAYNNSSIVKRVLNRFGLNADDNIHIKGTNKKFLKTPAPLSIFDLLSTRVELATPITQRQLRKLAEKTGDEQQRLSIERLAGDDVYQTEVLAKKASILDILESHSACALSLSDYLDMLKAMATRQYSISSSPLAPRNFASPKLIASLTYDVHSGGELYNSEKVFNGVASSYLARLSEGNRIHCSVKSTNAAFHLPTDVSAPVIMIAAGTGLAPMRGFMEERAAIANATGKKLGPALLYFGCRDYEKDYIYRTELEHWQELGVVSLRPTFSQRWPWGTEKTWKYVPDRMWDERDEIAELFHQNGKIFLCGSASKLAKSCAEACMSIYTARTGCTEPEACQWLESVKETRYVSDVFG